MSKRKPKFKVGDRIIDKKMIKLPRQIIRIEDDEYVISGLFGNYEVTLSFDYIERHYTLDLNHYIKSL